MDMDHGLLSPIEVHMDLTPQALELFAGLAAVTLIGLPLAAALVRRAALAAWRGRARDQG
jgi:hypothetical protein